MFDRGSGARSRSLGGLLGPERLVLGPEHLVLVASLVLGTFFKNCSYVLMGFLQTFVESCLFDLLLVTVSLHGSTRRLCRELFDAFLSIFKREDTLI